MFNPKTYTPRLKTLALIISACGLVLSGCSDTTTVRVPVVPTPPPPPPAMAKFDVTVLNLTNAQPFSPLALITHRADYSLFQVGSAATLGLEHLAEGGEVSTLINEATSNVNVVTTRSGTGPIPPSGSQTFSIEMLESDLTGLFLSAGTMLVNTNDAFTGLNRIPIANMAAGDVRVIRSIAYDSGTEANSERAVHIPGPAGGGEGFNPMRDDRLSVVAMHLGIVSSDDGFATSDLTDQHRIDNPVAQFRIERTE